jgi:hypothetical protein
MPFLLYRFDPHPGEYRLIRGIRLAGKNGPFKAVFDDLGGPEWHLMDTHILRLLEEPEPEEHRIVIDLKPNAQREVSLYRLRDVWGYTEAGWTPLALRLESLYADSSQDNPSAFKHAFVEPPDRYFIYEFLYLKGNWNWGRVGGVNGAMLWPDALRYFFKAINRQVSEDARANANAPR